MNMGGRLFTKTDHFQWLHHEEHDIASSSNYYLLEVHPGEGFGLHEPLPFPDETLTLDSRAGNHTSRVVSKFSQIFFLNLKIWSCSFSILVGQM